MRKEETAPRGRWMPYGMETAVTIRHGLWHEQAGASDMDRTRSSEG
jgi:hypothetical protein